MRQMKGGMTVFEFWRQPVIPPTPTPTHPFHPSHPEHFWTAVALDDPTGTFGQWQTDTVLLFCLPKSPLPYITSCILWSRGVGMLLRGIFCNPKGQLAQLWKTVEILTLAINAHKLGNLSCFIMLSPATRQHWRPLIGENKRQMTDCGLFQSINFF